MRSLLLTGEFEQKTYSETIDVRSEGEYAEDRIPRAINLPVLNNEERAKVGTIYKQVSPFEARKIGAALVSQNIARYLHNYFAEKDENYSPLIYCWRGGQRSQSLALILERIGWQVTVLDGGYRGYRSWIREQLIHLPQQFNYTVLCGLTGTGKTRILQQMARQGEQVLDLEKLAGHRGSLLGQEWQDKLEPQPSQKYFESLFVEQLQQFDRDRPVWVESESHKIGKIYLPQTLWEKIKQSPTLEVQLPLAERVNWLLQEYAHFIEHPQLLKEKLHRLKTRCGSQKLQQWYEWCDRGEWRILIEDLLVSYYDPAYHRSLHRFFQPIAPTIQLDNLSEDNIEAIVEQFAIYEQPTPK